jgi:prevent-host-death family protein
MDTYGIEEARNQLGDFIERIRLNDEHIALSRYGKPVAVLVPQEWYDEAKALISAQNGQS